MRIIDKNFEFSHSLVSSYQGWLNSETDYNRFYGNSENVPLFSEYELERKLQFYTALFRINLKPEFKREDTALMLGRNFEDALNSGKKSSGFKFLNNRNAIFNVVLNDDFNVLIENREKLRPKQQVKIAGMLPNGLHFVGYADEVYDNCIIDIKTTSNFAKINYDKSLQLPLYLHFINNYPVQRAFYQVTEFYRSKAAGKNEFTQKDTFIIEAQNLTNSQLSHFSDLCAEILNNVSIFKKDLDKYQFYFNF